MAAADTEIYWLSINCKYLFQIQFTFVWLAFMSNICIKGLGFYFTDWIALLLNIYSFIILSCLSYYWYASKHVCLLVVQPQHTVGWLLFYASIWSLDQSVYQWILYSGNCFTFYFSINHSKFRNKNNNGEEETILLYISCLLRQIS